MVGESIHYSRCWTVDDTMGQLLEDVYGMMMSRLKFLALVMFSWLLGCLWYFDACLPSCLHGSCRLTNDVSGAALGCLDVFTSGP